MNLILERLSDQNFLFMLGVSIATAGIIFSLTYPIFAGNNLTRRMKAVAVEREKIRKRERMRLEQGIILRQSPKAYMKNIVDKLKVHDWLGQEDMKLKLVRAGMRGQSPYITFLFARLIAPAVFFVLALIYFFGIADSDQPGIMKIILCLAIGYFGVYAPNLYVKNAIDKRQLSIKRAFPDALDLLLICVDSGMSVEAAFRRVSQEIGTQSVELAEELTLTTAELSYLQDRRQAYENLAKRTDLEGVKGVCTALVQAEKYGTPVGQALKVMAQENRDMRMAEAEKKAAALPPKLTVPMILFFLPCLFIVILGPAFIQVMEVQQ